MRHSLASLAATALIVSAGGASFIAAAQGGEDRSETVAGWRVEDVDDELEEDPLTRTIRMTREVDGHELSYEMTLYPGGGSGWSGTRFGISTHSDNQACSRSASAATEIGPPAERAARLRELLSRELRRIERECRATPGTLDMLLAGLEPAFARFSAYHDDRHAAIQAAETQAEDAYALDDSAMDDNMTVEMNMADAADMMVDMNATDMDTATELSETDTNISTNMNMTAEELEAPADATENALRAAEEAMNAFDPK